MANNIFKQKEVQLDTFIDKNVQAVSSFSQGDSDSIKLIIDLSNSNTDLDLTEAVNVRVDFRKPDGKLVFQYCNIDDRAKGIVSVVLTSQTVATAGEVKAEVTVNYPLNKSVVTRKFAFHVHEAFASDSSLESTNEFPMLVQAIDAGKKFEGVNIELLTGVNNYSTVPTFTNGQLTKVEEKDGSTVVSSSTLTYNTDGTVKDVTEVVNGKTVKTTLNYVNGEFSSITKAVS